MRALDSAVLLDVLRGETRASRAFPEGETTELVATELAFAELSLMARWDAGPGRERRLAALDRLRRHIAFLPLDEAAARAIAGVRLRMPRAPPWFAQHLGVLESRGVAEWVVPIPKGRISRAATKVALVDYR